MISKIGIDLDKRNSNVSVKKQQTAVNYSTNPQNNVSSAGKLNLNYFVPFTSNDNKKLENLMLYTDTSGKNLIAKLKKDVKDSGYDKITTLHVLKHGLVEANKYIDDLNSGKVDFNENDCPPMAGILANEIVSKMFSEPEGRKIAKPIIDKNIKIADKLLKEEKPENPDLAAEPIFSDDMVDSVWGVRENPNDPVNASLIYGGAFSSEDDITADFVDELSFELKDQFMINHTPMSQRAPFSEYEKKAENVLKNLSLGANVFVTYNYGKESPGNFLDTIKKVFDKKGDKNTTYTEFNSDVKADYFEYVVNSLAKDKKRQHIIVANPTSIIINEGNVSEDGAGFCMPQELTQILAKPPANVKFLFHDAKGNYYSALQNPYLSSRYSEFEEMSIPSLSTAQMLKSFKENPNLMKDISKPFSKNAIEKVVEVSAQIDGAFPEKTQKLMKKIVSYYIDKKEINDKDVVNYIKEATNILKKDSDAYDVVFDTGKRLNKMVGKSTTKKEAANIVKQIKSNKMGTKGIIIYSEDGTPGSGRRFTAKAIAGEARVPYVEMNAVDFGTKDVDIFGGGAISPEAAVKKLFGIVKTQAEANANKSAVLFIENFEYFSIGELVSWYHQKAMAQLLREMDKAEKEGLNILVAGAVANPELIGEATMKSFKFVDSIEVASPAFSKIERSQVVEHILKSNKVKLAGDSAAQKNLIDYATDITQYFSYIDVKKLVKKAQSVADERGHKALTKADITEAYLQLTTGRPALRKIEDHEKRVVSSHECGHAVNLQVMNNLAKTLGKPWHIPSKVNFITLDPRGNYGGAVYEGKDINSEYPFEILFADMVCAFGGNSAESRFFGFDGSWGISSDMKAVRHSAEMMVKVMGLGAKTGKMSIGRNEDLSEKMKTMIEDDERVIINNAKITSEMITEIYSDFNKWFTDKYAPLVGTGECIIDGDEFRKVLKEWKAKQPADKQKMFKECDETIIKIMEATKKGIAVRKKEK